MPGLGSVEALGVVPATVRVAAVSPKSPAERAGLRADEIVAAMGGTYYGQEAPGLPSFLTRGGHFEKGQPLYIVEVMKMFNKVYASFAGTIDAVVAGTHREHVVAGTPDRAVAAVRAGHADDPAGGLVFHHEFNVAADLDPGGARQADQPVRLRMPQRDARAEDQPIDPVPVAMLEIDHRHAGRGGRRPPFGGIVPGPDPRPAAEQGPAD